LTVPVISGDSILTVLKNQPSRGLHTDEAVQNESKTPTNRSRIVLACTSIVIVAAICGLVTFALGGRNPLERIANQSRNDSSAPKAVDSREAALSVEPKKLGPAVEIDQAVAKVIPSKNLVETSQRVDQHIQL
jgi:hypothetical protein